jgi:hypothetical protein
MVGETGRAEDQTPGRMMQQGKWNSPESMNEASIVKEHLIKVGSAPSSVLTSFMITVSLKVSTT